MKILKLLLLGAVSASMLTIAAADGKKKVIKKEKHEIIIIEEGDLHGLNFVDENEIVIDLDMELGDHNFENMFFMKHGDKGGNVRIESFPKSKKMHWKKKTHFGMRNFKEMDSNKDGKVTKDEFIKAKNKYISIGRKGVSFEKYQKLVKEAKIKRKAAVKERHLVAAKKRKLKRAKERFAKIDINKNGKISKSELTKYAALMFAKMDKNGDGVLTKEKRSHKKMPWHLKMKKFKGSERKATCMNHEKMRIKHKKMGMKHKEMSLKHMQKHLKHLEARLKSQKELIAKMKVKQAAKN